MLSSTSHSLVQNVWRSAQQSQIARGGDVCHKLTAQISGNQIYMIFLKMEIHTQCLDSAFYPAIGAKIPLAWGEQKIKDWTFKAKNYYGKSPGHRNYTKKHLSENFKVSSESEHSIIFCH